MGNEVAIHHRDGSFSDRWIEYCSDHHIPFKVVNCYANDILSQLQGVKALLWHWAYQEPADVMISKAILRMAESLGVKVYPDLSTCWHFDDKISQKYLLEFLGAPLVPTYVFFNKEEAIEWAEVTSFPKVFKLSKGAGSVNVRLIHNVSEANNLIGKAFGRGIKRSEGYFVDMNKKVSRLKLRKDYFGVITRMPKAVLASRKKSRRYTYEKAYAYFQDFVPGNRYDTRITIIGERAFGFTRDVRKNDFRASGSGSIVYDLERIDIACVKIAFDVAMQIGAQSLAFDFVQEPDGKSNIVEVSYGFASRPVYECAGHWDKNLNWHEGHLWPQDAILTDLLS